MSSIDENRRTLIETLRYGSYKQGKFFLRRKDDKFCVVGVMCDIVDPSKWTRPGSGSYRYGDEGGLRPPDSVYELYGLTHYNDKEELAATYWMIVSDGGKTFPQIADIMEDKWKLKCPMTG